VRALNVNIGYPPFMGGAQVYMQQLARRLVRRGHLVEAWVSDAEEVELLWSRGMGRLAVGESEDEGVRVRRFAVKHLPLSRYAYHGLRRAELVLDRVPWIGERFLWAAARYTPWLPAMERALRWETHDFDLVHGWNIPFEPLVKGAMGFARRHGLPFVVTPLLHLGEDGDDDVRRLYTMRHQMGLIRDSDEVIALTDLEAEYMASHGVAEERIHVVPGAVDVVPLAEGDAARFRREHGVESPFVLYIGLLNPNKGAIDLVQAMARLWERGVEAGLVMIGRSMKHFDRFLDTLEPGARARCHLLGQVDERTKADALAACEILALPSRTESFGLVFLEAWACAKPVVWARAGAIPYVVDEGVDGVLAPFGDIEALAQSILDLLMDPERAAAMGQAGRAKVRERYTWGRVTDRTEAIYESVLDRFVGSRG
jgi:glycosyltransferase involved in cell wall biosynthesis